MKNFFLLLISVFFISIFTVKPGHSQTLEVMGGNVLNGAVTGTALGLATMGLQNSSDFSALRIGLGAGIIGGIGIAVYDLTTLPQGHQFFISGVFNDGSNSSIIILLDTIYGAAAGSLIGTAVMLLDNRPVTEGLQYGSAIGAWAGFGFGLADSFFLAERNRDFISDALMKSNSVYSVDLKNSRIDLLRPDYFTYYSVSSNNLSYEIQPVANLVTFSTRF